MSADASAPPATAEMKPLKSGLLQKRSRNRSQSVFSMSAFMSNWSVRLVTLYPSHLKYETPEGVPKGIFALSAETKVLMSDVDNRHFSIKLVTEGEDFYVSFPDEDTRQDWFQALKTVTDPAMIAAAMAEMVEKEQKRMSQISDAMKEAAIAEAYRQEQHALLMTKKNEAVKMMSVAAKCNKKLSTESKYTERHIWVDVDKNEFHWGKREYQFHSKAVNLKDHVKQVTKLSENSFALELVEKEKLPAHLFQEGFVFSNTAPTSVDIYIEDREYCAMFVDILQEMHATGTVALA